MTKRQFRFIIFVACLLIVGQTIQTALLLRAETRIQKTAESAEMAAIDTLELAKRNGVKQPDQEANPPDEAQTRLLSARGKGHRSTKRPSRHAI